MTSPYLDRPLRTLDQAQRDIEQDRARRALAGIRDASRKPLEPVYRFEPRHTILNPPPAWLAPSSDEDEEVAGPLFGAERFVTGLTNAVAFTAGLVIVVLVLLVFA